MKVNEQDTEDEERKAVFDMFIRDSLDLGSCLDLLRWKLIDKGAAFQMTTTHTTANACAHGTFHFLRNMEDLGKLRKELDEAWKDAEADMKYEQLEELLYLLSLFHYSKVLSSKNLYDYPVV
ncbi:hypothetical protein E1B28_009428 [Marasmius oreades]|uniref:Uncharacterized protein n=1 Tax=Marasmius oreades TaxID=181124 RepID=A0A9P7S132_9AGAR|nr:uncharacterized protein E1B28_009428 [Marasmius oreades]KAG7093145.1 hypothetical protein E1B28_009428 [Marasmius oreades]